MIYSFFIFFNELDLLDLKISEETPFVDKIVVVEAYKTFSGKPKSKNFPVKKYADNPKVDYFFLNDESLFKGCVTARNRLQVQRDYPRKKYDIKDDDIVIVSDVDEIICGEWIPKIAEETRKLEFVSLALDLHYYFLNTDCRSIPGAFAIVGRLCREFCFNKLRYSSKGILKEDRLPKPGGSIKGCGHHFSFLGSPESIALKIGSFAHTELDREEFTDIKQIEKRISDLKDLFDRLDGYGNQITYSLRAIDESYPKTVLSNLTYWQKYIKQ